LIIDKQISIEACWIVCFIGVEHLLYTGE